MSADIATGLAGYLASKRRVYPQHVNRISSLDDPCLRRLYYMRAAWDKARPTDTGLQGIFETGNVLEPVIERIVSEVGLLCTPPLRVVGTQTPTRDNLLAEYNISGTIDGFLQALLEAWETLGVVDIKTMSPQVYRSVQTYADLSRYPWTRRYRGQLMLYALAHNLETCFLLLVNKTNLFDQRLIEFKVDMAYCEGLLQKAKAVNEAVEAKEPPEGMDDPDECPRCPWFDFCTPDLAPRGNLEVIDNEELAAILDRLAALEEQAAEIAALEKQRDNLLVKGHDMAVGDWIVQWKRIESHRKASTAAITESWRKTIRRLSGHQHQTDTADELFPEPAAT